MDRGWQDVGWFGWVALTSMVILVFVSMRGLALAQGTAPITSSGLNPDSAVGETGQRPFSKTP